MVNGGGRTEGWTDGRLKIPPCVLQDIGPLGPLPKKCIANSELPLSPLVLLLIVSRGYR